MRKYNLFLISVIIFLSSCCIFFSDSFHQMVSPDAYWNQKVKKIEKCISMFEWKLSSKQIELAQAKIDCEFNLKDALLKASSLDEDKQELVKRAKDENADLIHDIENELKSLKGALKKTRTDLKQALDNKKEFDKK